MKKTIIIIVLLLLVIKTIFANDNTYLNFTSVQGSISISLNSVRSPNSISLQYSMNNCGSWVNYTIGQTIQLSSGSKVFFKATTTNSSIGSANGYYKFVMSGTGDVYADGNTMSLLDSSMQQTSVPAYAFYGLFDGCTRLVKAPALPATTLGNKCYKYMFTGCTFLETPPVLPAMTLATECYYSMFSDCIWLSNAPALPATSLAVSCYANMFYGCTSLNVPPVLSSMNLAGECYSAMFFDCTSLVVAPSLPATTLANKCYYCMFQGCTSLNAAPALPALVLSTRCYFQMFYGCTSLTNAPALPATILTEGCYSGMFGDCWALDTAPALPATSLAQSCYMLMFYNCLSLSSPPVLPAMTLSNSCYKSMFYNCGSLTTAPALPATSLEISCYSHMFYNCISLTSIPNLPSNTLMNDCYSYMFSGCTSLVVNETHPGTEWIITARNYAPYAMDSMFRGTSGSLTTFPTPDTVYYIASDPNRPRFFDILSNNTIWGYVTGGGYYLKNDTAIITATPRAHHHFVKWNNGNTSDTIVMPVICDTSMIAIFAPDKYIITVTSNDTVMGNVTGGGTFDYGQIITLNAIPKTHHHFVSWNNGLNTPSITFLVSNDTTFMASFAIDQHTITAVSNDGTMGCVTGGGLYNYGQTVTLTATANEHYHFVSWNNGQTTPSISIVIGCDSVFTATFEPDVYNVTAIANDSSRGIVTGSGQYNYLEIISLVATPYEEYVFTCWDNGENDRVLYVTVVSDTVITAIFDPVSSSVNDVEDTEYIVYSNENNIHINGAAGEPIRIYDINGKLISEVEEASDEQIVSVYVAGVYFVRINEKKSIKVVVK